MSAEENMKLQREEIEALSSIFSNDWECVDDLDRVYNVVINIDGTQNQVVLQIVFVDGYPLNGPLIYRLNAPWIKREIKQRLANELEELISENIGQAVVFMCIEKIKEFFEHESSSLESSITETSDDLNEEDYENSLKTNTLIENTNSIDHDTENEVELPNILHGEPICDRKSTFQAHLAPVISRKQVKLVLDKLLENKKVSNATHNIMAYRIVKNINGIESVISNCDDDGEASAGSRMLFLMKTLEAKNVMVVVSRWYGGIHLGPDRFKHINECCRNILNEHGYIDAKQKSQGKKKK